MSALSVWQHILFLRESGVEKRVLAHESFTRRTPGMTLQAAFAGDEINPGVVRVVER